MKLTRLLRRAYAIEIGAYHAYEGHWRSLPKDSVAQNTIKAIQCDEVIHRELILRMLKELESKPSPILNAVLWVIGKSISAACHVLGYKAAMWGAKIMEVMGAGLYRKLARIARDEGHPAMGVELDFMQRSEEDHERYLGLLMSGDADPMDDIPYDTCMCGDAMKNHDSPLNCGHSPLSMRDHYLRAK